MEREPHPAGTVSGQAFGENGARSPDYRNGPKPWPWVVLSVLVSLAAAAAVGCLCALLYPVLTELREETVRGVDGTEERMLGFWSVFVLSVFAGSICCVFSWTLTNLNLYHQSVPTLLMLSHRDVSGFHLDYSVAVLNGIMAMLTVIWNLT
ncbi:ADP-ribosylation factor-like protein 6-interacting protein 6 [Aulostomus maculatus]